MKSTAVLIAAAGLLTVSAAPVTTEPRLVGGSINSFRSSIDGLT